MKKNFIIFCLFIFCGCFLFAQNECTDKAGNFSFIMPYEWYSVKLPSVPYKAAAGEMTDGFIPTMVVTKEKCTLPVDEYVASIKQILSGGDLFADIIKEENFTTENGLDTKKIIVQSTYQNISLRQYVYIFQSELYYCMVTCTVLSNASENIEAIFDESMKTFVFLQKDSME